MPEFGYPSPDVHGGFGLFTRRGIQKPAYHALKFINSLNTHIVHRDQNCIITTNEYNDEYTILLNNDVDYSRDFDPQSLLTKADLMLGFDISWNIELLDIKPGCYQINKAIIVTTKDLTTITDSLNISNNYIDKNTVNQINKLTKPHTNSYLFTVNDKINFTEQLKPTETMLLKIKRI